MIWIRIANCIRIEIILEVRSGSIRIENFFKGNLTSWSHNSCCAPSWRVAIVWGLGLALQLFHFISIFSSEQGHIQPYGWGCITFFCQFPPRLELIPPPPIRFETIIDLNKRPNQKMRFLLKWTTISEIPFDLSTMMYTREVTAVAVQIFNSLNSQVISASGQCSSIRRRA